VFVEQHRRLGAALHQAQAQSGLRSVMVASAVAGEGKTLTATNLALTLSRSFGKRVLLVDGDLRKPSVHTLLELRNAVGLTDLLERPGGRFPAIALSPTLSVVTAGREAADPVALLSSNIARQFFADTREQFDWVVVDTPPVVLFPDAGLFAAAIEACIFVVGAAATTSTAAKKAVETIGAAKILGAVLNRAEPGEVAAGYGYRYGGYARNAREGARFAGWLSGGR
jgi:capsular exopolysaccharide synthesis family protein